LRAKLGLQNDLPVFLVNFGGSGKTAPTNLVAELQSVPNAFQTVFITRKNEELKRNVLQSTAGMKNVTVLGWVGNMHEWMAASDLLLSRAGGGIVAESLNCELPILVFDAPPGNERRFGEMIETVWHSGYWVRDAGDLSKQITRLLGDPGALRQLRENALAQARPEASRDAAEAVLNLARRFSHATTPRG
jgi:UDP-N-acetylglucosamine:LPS N-acetylglucosamine transferase